MAKKFFLGMAAILTVYIAAAWGISVLAAFNIEQVLGLKLSGILATVNVTLAYLVIYFAQSKEQSEFAKIFLSGMVVRLFALLAFIFIIFNYSRADHFVFIGSLFILYFVYQIWEIFIISKQNK